MARLSIASASASSVAALIVASSECPTFTGNLAQADEQPNLITCASTVLIEVPDARYSDFALAVARGTPTAAQARLPAGPPLRCGPDTNIISSNREKIGFATR